MDGGGAAQQTRLSASADWKKFAASPLRRMAGKWLNERPSKKITSKNSIAARNSNRKWLPLSLMAFAGLAWSTSAQVIHAASTMGTTSIIPGTAVGYWQLMGVAIMLMLQAAGWNTISTACGSLQQLAFWYSACLDASPILTKSVTAGVIGIIGDYMAQWLEYKLERRKQVEPTENSSVANAVSIHGRYSLRRGLSILADGLFISGPLMHFGYNLFESIIPIGAAGAAASSVAALTHVIADSIVLDSVFVASTFLVTGIFEGYTMKQLVPQFRTDYIPALKASWVTSVFLLPLEFLCFRCLPLNFRVLAVNFLDIVWDAVISFMAHRNRKHDHVGAAKISAHSAQSDVSKLESVARRVPTVPV